MSRADISYVAAIRSTRNLCEALISRPGDQSVLGLAQAIQRLESLFPAWGPCLRDDTSKLRQKDLLKEAVATAHSDFLRQLGERDRSRVESYSGAWADGWIRAIPSQVFDLHLPNVAFHDVLSMRLGLSIFDIDEEYQMCPQSSDTFDYHCLSCNRWEKSVFPISSGMKPFEPYGVEDWESEENQLTCCRRILHVDRRTF